MSLKELVQSLSEAISLLEINQISKTLISFVKSNSVTQNETLSELEVLKKENNSLNYYRILLRLGYVEEVLKIYETPSVDRFSLEFVTKNICRYASSEQLVDLLTKSKESSHVHCAAYRIPLLKKLRKTHPKLIDRLVNHTWSNDTDKHVLSVLVPYAPVGSDTYNNILPIIKEHFNISTENYLQARNDPSKRKLIGILMRRRVHAVLDLIESVLASNGSGVVDRADLIQTHLKKFCRIRRNLYKRAVGETNSEPPMNRFLDLIEKYGKRVNGFPVLPMEVTRNLISNSDISEKMLSFIFNAMNKETGEIQSFSYSGVISRPLDLRKKLPLRTFKKFLDHHAFCNHQPYTSSMLYFIQSQYSEREKNILFNTHLQNLLKKVEYVEQMLEDIPSLITCFPSSEIESLSAKVIQRLKESNQLTQPWRVLQYYVGRPASRDLHDEMTNLVRRCNDQTIRASLYTLVMDHILYNKVDDDRLFSYLLKTLTNETIQAKTDIIGSSVKYFSHGTYVLNNNVLQFYSQLVDLIVHSKDRTVATLENAFNNLARFFLGSIATFPPHVFNENMEKILSLSSLFDKFLEKKVALPVLYLNQRELQLFYRFVKPYMIAALDQDRIHDFVKLFHALFGNCGEKNILSRNFDLWDRMFSPEKYSIFIEARTNMTQIIKYYLKIHKKERIQMILQLDPSVVNLEVVQEHLFFKDQRTLLKFTQFSLPITVEHLRSISSLKNFSCLAIGKDITFKSNLILAALPLLNRDLLSHLQRYMINFIMDENKQSDMYSMKKYTRILAMINEATPTSEVTEFLESPTIKENASISEFVLHGKLFGYFPQNNIALGITSLTSSNCSLLHGAILHSLKYTSILSWVPVVKKTIKTNPKVGVLKALVRLLGATHNFEICENIYYELWSDKNTHVDVKKFILAEVMHLLDTSEIAWKILEETSRQDNEDLVMKLIEFDPPSQHFARYSNIIRACLQHENVELRKRCRLSVSIRYLSVDIITEEFVNLFDDFESKENTSFESLVHEIRSASANTVFADGKNLVDLLTSIVDKVCQLLSTPQEYIEVDESNSATTIYGWDQPAYTRVKKIIQMLFHSNIDKKERESLCLKMMNVVIDFEKSFCITIWTEMVSNIDATDSDMAISTLSIIKQQIEETFANSPKDQYFALSSVIQCLNNHQITAEKAVNYFMKQQDEIYILFGLAMLKEQYFPTSHHELNQIVLKLRKHTSNAVRRSAREISLRYIH